MVLGNKYEKKREWKKSSRKNIATELFRGLGNSMSSINSMFFSIKTEYEIKYSISGIYKRMWTIITICCCHYFIFLSSFRDHIWSTFYGKMLILTIFLMAGMNITIQYCQNYFWWQMPLGTLRKCYDTNFWFDYICMNLIEFVPRDLWCINLGAIWESIWRNSLVTSLYGNPTEIQRPKYYFSIWHLIFIPAIKNIF